MTTRQWKLRDPHPASQDATSLYQAYRTTEYVTPIIRSIAQRRPLYVSNDIDTLPLQSHPVLTAAAVSVAALIREQATFLVWGDYDADGMTATAVLTTLLQQCGANVKYAVPNRLDSGYGIDIEAIRLATAGIDPKQIVIITVDNGIAEHDKIEELKTRGYRIIVTDHHLPEGPLPETMHCNPKVYCTPDDEYYMASGCYVAAMLGIHTYLEVKKQLPSRSIMEYTAALVALSLVSDVIELNRTMRDALAYGLTVLHRIPHDGIRALFRSCGHTQGQPITATYLAFSFIPKLNAAGRMGNPILGVRLLLCGVEHTEDTAMSAALWASELIELNTERKVIESRIYDEAFEMAVQLKENHPHGLVLYKEEWHSGVLGVIAARLVESCGVPVIVMTNEQGFIKGSGRSISGIDLHAVLGKCKDTILAYGGHAAAAGVQTDLEHLPAFQQMFNAILAEETNEEAHTLEVDALATVGELHDVRTQLGLRSLEPTGNLNPEPYIQLNRLRIISSEIRRGALSMVATNETDETIVLSKYRPDATMIMDVGTIVDVVVSPSYLYFSGVTTVEWRIQAIRTAVVQED